MLFNSLQFLIFFPIVLFLYFRLRNPWRNRMLLAASCYFYMAFVPAYMLVLAGLIVVDYVAGLLIGRSTGRSRTLWLAASLVANVGVLCVFKYWNFLNAQVTVLTGLAGIANHVPSLNMLLPIGLSFHTFQAMSYTIEVYRGNVAPERRFDIYALYVMFFPQLVAGPIERPQNLLDQLRAEHAFDYDRATRGLRLMFWGFFKKVVIADRIAVYVDAIYRDPTLYNGVPLALATYLFAVQIYCDFSGYSDIAIGSAEVMGVRLMKNFDRPYSARSIAEFWRRWHISLSTWFRDYVYIPLGGSKAGGWKFYRNIMIVFALSGLWHGANWTFIVWGLLHGSYIVFGHLTASPRQRMRHALGLTDEAWWTRAWQTFVTFHLVLIAWVFFRANTVFEAGYVIKHMFVPAFNPYLAFNGFGLTEVVIAASAILIMELIQRLRHDYHPVERVAGLAPAYRWSLYYLGTFALLAFGVFSNRQFIYFQF